ncbi:hypothetical protein BV25DRAFT_587746 [Artomyces pyxidatus]|uniref:Uncharacterized protein n=1 Tax=Artomyces pyxidatus TaxID=48021 RepID=A0ACB8TJ42_9AGAM|nr:hypothetical protein BV25DRAFT_587746 [Artomyces pyxidatus]
MEAVKDTVTLRSNDLPPRTRPSRSHTGGPGPQPVAPSSRSQAVPTRRSQSSDSVPQAEKTKSSGRSKPSKKGSQHADVIDRLDFTGVGPMFHHDGPFDACAPSRNRTRTKAPMYAWTAINHEDEQVAARYREQDGQAPPAIPNYESPFPSPELAKTMQANYYPEPPKKKVDAIAEAWGIHEPEPYEEFFAGGGGRDNDASPNHTAVPSSGRDGRGSRRNRDARREVEDSAAVPRVRGARRPTIPPPQPIFVAEDAVIEPEYPASPPQPGSPGLGGAAVGRNKSLMHRIRKMRDAPNVPVAYSDMGAPAPGNEAPSPTSSGESAGAAQYATRPTHRSQNSFLGRLGLHGRENVSPTSEAYVYVEDPKTKDLPATPHSPHYRTPSGENEREYFEARDGSGAATTPGGGLGRKTSLMKKVKGVVRGGK